MTPLPFEVMGIVNVTPDSFSDGGAFLDPLAGVAHGLVLASDGAAIVDIGGESTRPGASAVAEDEELARVVPVITGLSEALERAGRLGQVRISIDTSKFSVARAALDAGATLINDVTAFRAAPELAGLAASRGAEICLVHMLGEPRTMQVNPVYDDVVSAVKSFLSARLEFVVSEGVPEEKVILDPGIGFGKSVAHNLALLSRVGELAELGRPVLIGTSRKSFLGTLTRASAARGMAGGVTGGRLAATIASNVLAFERGASIFRVHDVAPVRDALTVTAAVMGA